MLLIIGKIKKTANMNGGKPRNRAKANLILNSCRASQNI